MQVKNYSKQPLEIEFVACPGCQMADYSIVTQTMDYDYQTTDMVFNIVRCNNCHLIYTNPRPKLSEIDKIYPPNYSAYQFNSIRNGIIRNARNFMQRKKALKILNSLPWNPEVPKIIDVGCGSPALLCLIKETSSFEVNLYGNDFNPDTLKMIQEAGFNAVSGAFEKINVKDDYFDLIIMNQVIEHLFDVPGILMKSFQTLKPGGILYIETPTEEGIDAKCFHKNHWGGYHVPRHLQIFNSNTISNTLSRYGFSIKNIEYIPSPNFWTSSIRNQFIRMSIPKFVTNQMNYKNVFFMTLFTALDSITRFFHPTSNMRVIAEKKSEQIV